MALPPSGRRITIHNVAARAARLLLLLIEQSTQRVSASCLLPVRLVSRGRSGRAPAAVA